MSEITEIAPHIGHGDLCLDAAGDDVLMLVGGMNSYRVRDGKAVSQVKRPTAAGDFYFQKLKRFLVQIGVFFRKNRIVGTHFMS